MYDAKLNRPPSGLPRDKFTHPRRVSPQKRRPPAEIVVWCSQDSVSQNDLQELLKLASRASRNKRTQYYRSMFRPLGILLHRQMGLHENALGELPVSVYQIRAWEVSSPACGARGVRE